MGLASIFNIPNTDAEWSEWSFSLQAELRDISRLIFQQTHIALPQFCLDPFNRKEPGIQLYQLQQQMNGINAVTGFSGFDYVDVDLNNPSDLSSWIFLLSQNVRQAADKLGI